MEPSTESTDGRTIVATKQPASILTGGSLWANAGRQLDIQTMARRLWKEEAMPPKNLHGSMCLLLVAYKSVSKQTR